MMASVARSVVIETAAKQLGYNLKTEQRAIITSFVKGENVFGILPTGFGKSLCYTILPIIFDRMASSGDCKSVIVIMTPNCYYKGPGKTISFSDMILYLYACRHRLVLQLLKVYQQAVYVEMMRMMMK